MRDLDPMASTVCLFIRSKNQGTHTPFDVGSIDQHQTVDGVMEFRVDVESEMPSSNLEVLTEQHGNTASHGINFLDAVIQLLGRGGQSINFGERPKGHTFFQLCA